MQYCITNYENTSFTVHRHSDLLYIIGAGSIVITHFFCFNFAAVVSIVIDLTTLVEIAFGLQAFRIIGVRIIGVLLYYFSRNRLKLVEIGLLYCDRLWYSSSKEKLSIAFTNTWKLAALCPIHLHTNSAKRMTITKWFILQIFYNQNTKCCTADNCNHIPWDIVLYLFF